MNNYVPVIGLEIHVELSTSSKMFCGCPADWFGRQPNTHTCPVCLGMPGALPVPNRQAVEWTILLAQALGCTINKHSKFDRKHYFYPDLPKGYQISQYDEPIGIDGKVVIAIPTSRQEEQPQQIPTSSHLANMKVASRSDSLSVKIRRIHLEEDTGKLIHEGTNTLVDFNRAGVPLVEIVTEPNFDNSEDVKRFLEELQIIVRYLGISDADMEKGSMRLEPNVSIREVSSRVERGDLGGIARSSRSTNMNVTPRNDNIELPNYKVEVKNINSFRFAKAAIEYELVRQSTILKNGELPRQETRGWDASKKKTVSQRTKEQAHDYRYFPEPDIPPMEFTDDELIRIKSEFPELPEQKVARYVDQFGVRYEDAIILTRSKELAEYFEEVCRHFDDKKFAASVIVNRKISTSQTPEQFATSLVEMLKPKITDHNSLERAMEQVVDENSRAVTDYKAGKETVVMFLVGQVMKKLKGQADARIVREKLKSKLQS